MYVLSNDDVWRIELKIAERRLLVTKSWLYTYKENKNETGAFGLSLEYTYFLHHHHKIIVIAFFKKVLYVCKYVEKIL